MSDQLNLPMIKVGPTFGDELKRAGITRAIAWDTETGEVIDLYGELTAEEKRTFKEVMDAHDPSKKP